MRGPCEGKRLAAALSVQALGLCVHVGATDDMLDLVARTAEEDLCAVLDLDGELARRREDEDGDLTPGRLSRRAQEVLDRGNEEGESLASAGAGLCEAVARQGEADQHTPHIELGATRGERGGGEGGETHTSTPVKQTGRVCAWTSVQYS